MSWVACIIAEIFNLASENMRSVHMCERANPVRLDRMSLTQWNMLDLARVIMAAKSGTVLSC